VPFLKSADVKDKSDEGSTGSTKNVTDNAKDRKVPILRKERKGRRDQENRRTITKQVYSPRS
jgi:hypothetical protein